MNKSASKKYLLRVIGILLTSLGLFFLFCETEEISTLLGTKLIACVLLLAAWYSENLILPKSNR